MEGEVRCCARHPCSLVSITPGVLCSLAGRGGAAESIPGLIASRRHLAPRRRAQAAGIGARCSIVARSSLLPAALIVMSSSHGGRGCRRSLLNTPLCSLLQHPALGSWCYQDKKRDCETKKKIDSFRINTHSPFLKALGKYNTKLEKKILINEIIYRCFCKFVLIE